MVIYGHTSNFPPSYTSKNTRKVKCFKSNKINYNSNYSIKVVNQQPPKIKPQTKQKEIKNADVVLILQTLNECGIFENMEGSDDETGDLRLC